jgi:methylisocitrate lyase
MIRLFFEIKLIIMLFTPILQGAFRMNIACAGTRFREALLQETPLQIIGTINAYTALLAKEAGFRALYLSGAGVANASFGLPDLAMTHLGDVLEEARRLTSVTPLPLLVDIDTGWGHAFTIERTVKEMIRAGVAAVHIEDQIQAKRCGHRPGKIIVDTQEMVDRLKAATDARTEASFVIMARTDALATEGLEKTLERLHHYVKAGADMIFLEGAKTLEDYQAVSQALQVPLLANMTEFGVTPLFTTRELAQVGVKLVLYPLSAFRAMSQAALKVFRTLREEGTQKNLLSHMQTREELYKVLDYHRYEELLDKLNQGK